LAIVGAALLALTPTTTPASTLARKTVVAEPILLSVDDPPAIDVQPLPGQGVALLMGGSGYPIPPVDLAQVAFENFAVPNGFGDYAPERLFTPEGLSPIFSGIKSLPFDTSVAQGVTIVEDAIKANIESGHDVVVGGVSQSATIDALVEQDIANGALGFQPTPEQLAFINLGDPSNPNGGLLERFNLPQDPNPTIPSLGLTFSGAAPSDTGIPTTIYTLEYDGFADFPRYPINFVSDLNAVMGIAIVHGQYIEGLEGAGIGLTPEQIANAIELPTTPGYDGGTTYFMSPFDGQLPLATLIQDLAGKPLADLLEPDLRVLVNLGYGPDPDIGWSNAPANVATPVGLFPSIDAAQFNTILQALSTGAQQGLQAFSADLSAASSGDTSGGAVTDILDMFSQTAAPTDPPSLTDIVNDLSSALSQSYALLLPTADIINALTTTLPLAEATLFTNFLQEGDLIDALGMPTAVATGLGTVAAGVEGLVLLENLPNIASDLSGIF
jgi:hypothetical protein